LQKFAEVGVAKRRFSKVRPQEVERVTDEMWPKSEFCESGVHPRGELFANEPGVQERYR
jgi:hypothetical protein